MQHNNLDNRDSIRPKYTHAEEKVIIIDLSNVLFKEDTNAIIKKVGFSRLVRYAFGNWKSPVDSCLSILEKMSKEKDQQPSVPLTFREHPMPLCIIQWQQGKKDYIKVQQEISDFIERLDQEHHFSSNNEKIILQTILSLSFDPGQLYDITKPDLAMIKLVKQLKDQEYKLYALTNISQESFTVLKTHYAELLNLFEGIGTSFTYNFIKPEKKIFDLFIQEHNLNPQECILIDNQPESIEMAQEIGMDTIHFTNAKECKQQLQNYGIL